MFLTSSSRTRRQQLRGAAGLAAAGVLGACTPARTAGNAVPAAKLVTLSWMTDGTGGARGEATLPSRSSSPRSPSTSRD